MTSLIQANGQPSFDINDDDLSCFPVPFTENTRVIIPVSDSHGPCGGAHTMDTMGGILIANRLGLDGTAVETAMDSYSYISTYDGGSAAVAMTDTSSNLIVVAGCGVNQVTYYYNELMNEGSHVVPVVFGRDGQGDYLHVQSSSNMYRIEYYESTVVADYGGGSNSSGRLPLCLAGLWSRWRGYESCSTGSCRI